MSWNIHYRCEFSVRERQHTETAWISLTKFIRNWIKYKPQKALVLNNEFYDNWFFDGGEWKSSGKQFYQVSTAFLGDKINGSHKYWAVQYIHPCQHLARRWKIDIAVETLEDYSFLFHLSVYNQILRGYIGELPEKPTPSVPLLVKNMIQSQYWLVESGSEDLSVLPKKIKRGEGMYFKSRLEDTTRNCPIVAINIPQGSESTIDTNNFAWTLSGAASVYEINDAVVDEELYHCLGAYTCRQGSIRVYMPAMSTDNKDDLGRHRFIGNRTISKFGEQKTLEWLADSLARRHPTRISSKVRSYFEIIKMDREQKIEQSKSEAKESAEIYLQYNKKIEQELDDALLSIEELQEQLSTSESDNKTLARKNIFLTTKLRSEATKSKNLCSKCQKLTGLDHLPNNLYDAVSLFSKTFDTRIKLLTEAIESARDASYGDYANTWRCLYAIYGELHTLIFDDNHSLGKAAEIFESKTTYRISLTESSTTNKDKRIMSSRRIEYEGKEYDCAPHITLQKNKSYLRIHFAITNNPNLIIITHCGDHLETAGTRHKK